MHRHRDADWMTQRGETLIESLIAIVIVAAVGIAAYSGLYVVIGSTRSHRESGVSETLIRSAAETIQDPSTPYEPRADCVGGNPYQPLRAEPGYTVEVSDVRYWTPGSSTPVDSLVTSFSPQGTTADCPASDGSDRGLQLLTVTVTAPSGQRETLELLKRRDSNAAP